MQVAGAITNVVSIFSGGQRPYGQKLELIGFQGFTGRTNTPANSRFSGSHPVYDTHGFIDSLTGSRECPYLAPARQRRIQSFRGEKSAEQRPGLGKAKVL